MAARIEFEREWIPKLTGNVDSQKKDSTLKNEKKTPTKVKALSNIKSESLKSAMNDFFKD
jgi:hypothetical protein